MTSPILTVFGGTGFVGRSIVEHAIGQGWNVRVATRSVDKAKDTTPEEQSQPISFIAVDYEDEASIEKALHGTDYAIYSIGLLYEKGQNRFQKAHCDYPAHIASVAKKLGISRLILISAIACDRSRSLYAQTKLQGEKAVLSAFPAATILRPSLIFGEGDGFFNLFANMFRYLPVLPLFGGGRSKFQPVFVGDVARAVTLCCTENGTKGMIYDIAGSKIYSFAELLRIIMDATNRRVPLIPIPFSMARVQACFLSLMPKPLLTQDQITSLQTDAVADPANPGLVNLGIKPTALMDVVPQYLARYRKGVS